ncbi:MAG: AraC family transcriptional regulator [Gammaproteobacteria bacterium]
MTAKPLMTTMCAESFEPAQSHVGKRKSEQIGEICPDRTLSSAFVEDRRIAISAAAYNSALDRVGGRRIESKSSARGGELVVALYACPPYELHVPPLDVARLSINLASVAVFGALASSGNREYQGRRHSLFYTPAGSDAHWSRRSHSRHLSIFFKAKQLEEPADGHREISSYDHPLLDVHVRAINPWIDALELAMGETGRFADDASLGLAHLIVSRLTCLHGRRVPALTPAALARVRDYVVEHLGETIRVADLAALTDLSVGRFALCFRVATGMSPHRFVISRRVGTAMGLLREGPMPMVEVAAMCGFSSQQHMATTMRRLAGVAPSSIRRRL